MLQHNFPHEQRQENLPSGPLFLVGARASGKSSIGALLARQLGWHAVDTDTLAQAGAGRSVAAMVAEAGWEYFRQCESLALREAARPRTVVATGGGIVLAPENRLFLRETGVVFYLHASPELLAMRLAKAPDKDLRPPLTGRSLVEEVEEVLAARLPLYREVCHYEVDASRPPHEIVHEICRLCTRSVA